MGKYSLMFKDLSQPLQDPRGEAAKFSSIGEATKSEWSWFPSVAPLSYGTSLKLARDQVVAERAAKKELRRLKREFASVGKLDEFKTYEKQEGNLGFFSSINDKLKNVYEPIDNMFMAGPYATAGAMDELLRTGRSADAFKRASVELANSIPGVELEDARKMNWGTLLAKHGASPWAAAAGGFALDIVTDPLTWVPGTLLVKGAKGAGKMALKHGGPAARAWEYMFQPERELKQLGEAGTAVLDYMKQRKETENFELSQHLSRIDEMLAWMQPHERTLFSLFIDRPQRMKQELFDMSNIGLLDKSRLKGLYKTVDEIKEFTDLRVKEAKAAGLIEPLMDYDFYFKGMNTKNPKLLRSYKKFLADRRTLVDPVDQTISRFMGPQLGRTTRTTLYDRFQGVLVGELRAMPELDIGNLLSHHTEDYVRWINWKKFLDNVVRDGRISAKVVGVDKLAKNPRNWENFKRQVRISSGDTYDVLEVTQKTIPRKSTEMVDKVVGGWVLPTPIVDVVKKADTIFKAPTAVEQFLHFIDDTTSWWRGWSTFGTGFHARNAISSTFMNWLAGVGTDYKGIVKGRVELPLKFGLRYLQGTKAQILGIGHGRLPHHMKERLDEYSKKVFGGDFKDVRVPRILDSNNRAMTWQEIVDEGMAHGVSANINKLWHDIPETAVSDLFGGPDSVSLADLAAKGMNPTLQLAYGIVHGAKKHTPVDYFTKVFGKSGMPLKLNRAVGSIVENNARWTLYLDRRMKGATAREAADAVTLWHFDYSNLTDVEKRVFRVIMPFYAWTRFAVPRMFFSMLENPGRYSKVPKLKHAIESLSANLGELPTPDYYDEVLATQLPGMHKDKPLFMQLDLPVNVLNTMNYNDIVSGLHPFVKRVFEAAPHGGYSFFLDAPIETFSGEESKTGLPISKGTEQTLSTLFPPLGKFLFRPMTAQNRGELQEQVLSELSGVRLRPLDVRRVLRARTFEGRKLAEDYRKLLVQQGLLRER